MTVIKIMTHFGPNTPLLYPLKTLENRKVFWCLQRVDKGCIGNKRVKISYTFYGVIYEACILFI